MGGFSTHFLEACFHYSTFAALILGGLTAIAAFIAGFSGYEVSDRVQKASDQKIAEAAAIAATANARTAEAQLELARLRMEMGPRAINGDIFIKAIQNQPKPSELQILYSEDAQDGMILGMQFQMLLAQAKWPVVPAQKINRDSPFLKDFPTGIGASKYSQVGILVTYGPMDMTMDAPTASNALMKAISKSLGAVSLRQDKAVPVGHIWIVILPKI